MKKRAKYLAQPGNITDGFDKEEQVFLILAY
ncbi:hypothetical protein J2Z52_001678 [Enterococcus rivorum]|nr:hypothetical protein [Enterococcus rivorum]